MNREPHPTDDRLLDRALGRLSAAAAADLDAHLAGCAACRRRYAETQTVCTHLPVEDFEPSPAFDARMRARLDALDEAAAPRRRGFAWIALPVAATAVCVLLLVLRPPDPRPEAVLEVSAEPELLADLELLESLEAVELIDVVDDLDAIRALPEEEG